MGVDLIPVGNNKIRFKNKSFDELTTEIKAVLDKAEFPNAEFLMRHALARNYHNPRKIREIKTKRDWSFREEDEKYSFNDGKKIVFDGPFDLRLTFSDSKIRFREPSCRYWVWFEDDEYYQNEWRKYMQYVVNLFGGNRVLYANDSSSFLEEYPYYEGTFGEIWSAKDVYRRFE